MTSRIAALLLLCLAVSACQCNQGPPATPTLKDEGQECARDEECKSGLCDAVPGFQTLCVRKCADGCNAGEVCTQLTPGRFSCATDRGGLCQACVLDGDCPYPSDKCLVVDGKNVCGRDCAFDQSCPTSYRCLNGAGADGRPKPQQCTPASGSCSCTAQSAGQAVSCDVTNGFGTCSGLKTCDGVGGYGACSAPTPAAETCNTKDDDCNGTVDDGPGTPNDLNHCGACNRACSLANATPTCVGTECRVQACATGYGNCDNLHPNGCEADFAGDVNNCNACGNRCQAAGATSRCDLGQCRFTCNQNFYDFDQDAANGCEYACTFQSATDLPDVAFTDANCDGIDGEDSNGIYVSPVGDDVNPGTRLLPKRTIGAGVQAAQQGNKRDVFVLAGSYAGPVDLTGVTGKNVAGGYAPAGGRWSRSAINATIVTGGNPALLLDGSNDTLVQFISFNGASASGTAANGDGESAYGAKVLSSTGVKLELLTLVAGNGAAGSAGTDGAGGSPGDPGVTGVAGCANDSAFGCSSCARPTGGAGGASSCTRSGGRGGQPGLNTSTAGSAGVVGQLSTPAGTGGPAYSGGASGYATPQPSQRGTDGTAGAGGTNGTASAALGTLALAGYLPPVGGAGVAGGVGQGGGGGGGGGGGCQDWVVFGFLQFCYCYTYGSSGGGGGGGGCGGGPGLAGRSGGASVALMLWNSQVQAQSLSLTPGRGGNGGRGGDGGGGGLGGTGAASVHDWGSQGYSGIGGRGGNGGRGGAGGHGAGGAGGPAIGLARNAASTINTSALSYPNLPARSTGGTSSGTAGLPGEVLQAQSF